MPRQSSNLDIPHVRTVAPLPFSGDIWIEVVQTLQISPQQARIVELLLGGMRDKQIAVALRLSVPTIRTYFNRIFQRVGVEDRVELILRVFQIAWSLKVEKSCRQSRRQRD